jgi:hypothetical protein
MCSRGHGLFVRRSRLGSKSRGGRAGQGGFAVVVEDLDRGLPRGPVRASLLVACDGASVAEHVLVRLYVGHASSRRRNQRGEEHEMADGDEGW